MGFPLLQPVNRILVHFSAITLDHLPEQFVLSVAKSADCDFIRWIFGAALRQLNTPGFQKTPDAVVAWLAIDILQVISCDVERLVVAILPG